MKVFISSLISGFEPFRAAAREAALTLRHQPIMAEDFGAKADSPQMACLGGLQSADLVVLIMGARYGYVQGSSGVSPTHEEYLEARDTKPILMYVQEGVERDEQQTKFLSEAQAWQGGQFRAAFMNAEELGRMIVRDLHDYELSHASGPLDARSLGAAAVEMLPSNRRNGQGGSPSLSVAMMPGPPRKALRPAQLEDPALTDDIHRQALFGEPRLFDKSKGIKGAVEAGVLVIEQERGARIELGEGGAVVLRLPLNRDSVSRDSFSSSFALIQEDVERELATAMGYLNWLLERIDPTRRLSHVALAASIDAAEHMGWRTLAEQAASPNSGTMRMGRGEGSPALVDLPRAELRLQPQLAVKDLTVSLRRTRQG
jgi:hypothetical protein